jgi:hypothetical protein
MHDLPHATIIDFYFKKIHHFYIDMACWLATADFAGPGDGGRGGCSRIVYRSCCRCGTGRAEEVG